ncbi:uncharacterized protein GGS22DRAFT_200482 [Annulohypoxylon maeteangense]|uniref:uncharacterized protein n=1 Tax=Annulohypoxylon maeteangense TaxID=1927788 RepID=UPI002008C755|nr:uncharacterized protein GGS22DRAFT_200482 [Annulohypoxylon maeteangense]KAI0884811.1 hypothetical protein GGS22DRAFT_200482 [Annulohypoxylon maeteangense]
MALPTGAAAYKKKDGILTLTPDRKNVIWTPNSAPGGPPSVSLSISNITNLQQTPDSAAKVMLKIFDKPPGSSDPSTYLFHFNSPSDPRAEANVIRDLLSKLLVEVKNNDPSVPRPAAPSGGSGGSASASIAFANAVNSKPTKARLFDDDALKNDITLQQSLLRADRTLSQMYMEARKTKPESMSDTTFNTQFWSARINLLRAHAIENNQKKGPYNVLAQVKPTMESSADPNKPSELKIKFSVEQIQMILNQHPLVKRIYNENVPPVKQNDFWERFFLSKLSKQLRGERVTELEKPDSLFDQYDEYDDIKDFKSKLLSQHIPHIIDVEGNEENQGGLKSGNRKDIEMRPRGRKEVPIIQTLNSISEKLLASTASRETDPTIPVEPENDTYRELALRDLRGDVEESRIILNIKEQSNFFSSNTDTISETASVYEKQKPSKVLKDVQGDLKGLGQYSAGGVDLHSSLGIDDDSESDEEGQKPAHVGSRASRKTAQKQILDSMAQQRAQHFSQDSDETSPMGLTPDMTQTCNLTHATTIEFIRQFWSAFLSGDPDRAVELGYSVEALKRSKDRINAVAEEAEQVREQLIKKRKEEIYQIYERTKRKIKFNSKAIRGGRHAVLTLMEPAIESIDHAINEYQKALTAEGIQASTE